MENKIGKFCAVRDFKAELKDLELNEKQLEGVLQWVDTIPIHIYGGENIAVKVKNGVVKVNEQLVDSKDLSFNNLPKDVRIQYLMDNDGFYSPFEIPDGTLLFNPFTGDVLQHNKDGKPSIPENSGVEIMSNPFSAKLTAKFEYKNGKAVKRWTVSEDNEWVETPLENKK